MRNERTGKRAWIAGILALACALAMCVYPASAAEKTDLTTSNLKVVAKSTATWNMTPKAFVQAYNGYAAADVQLGKYKDKASFAYTFPNGSGLTMEIQASGGQVASIRLKYDRDWATEENDALALAASEAALTAMFRGDRKGAKGMMKTLGLEEDFPFDQAQAAKQGTLSCRTEDKEGGWSLTITPAQAGTKTSTPVSPGKTAEPKNAADVSKTATQSAGSSKGERAAAQAGPAEGSTVYVTDTGLKYHRDGCRSLNERPARDQHGRSGTAGI